MKTVLYAAAAASLVAGASFAGGYVAPVEQPVVAAPVVAAQDIDWTGFYAGLQYGTGDADADFIGLASGDDDFDALGVHVGYLHDMGQWIIGAELDYNKLDWDSGDDDTDLIRLRGRVGYDMGRFQPYVTLGIARASGDVRDEDLGDFDYSETGFTYGIGAEYLIAERFSIGAEYTRTEFSDFMEDEVGVGGIDVDANLFQVRASYRF